MARVSKMGKYEGLECGKQQSRIMKSVGSEMICKSIRWSKDIEVLETEKDQAGLVKPMVKLWCRSL